MKKVSVLIMGQEESMVQALESKGMNVIKTSNIWEAKEALKTHAFDVVVADISYTGMNEGLEAAKFIYQSHPFIVIGSDQFTLSKFEQICDCLVEREEIGDRLYKAALKAIERRSMGITFAS